MDTANFTKKNKSTHPCTRKKLAVDLCLCCPDNERPGAAERQNNRYLSRLKVSFLDSFVSKDDPGLRYCFVVVSFV